ncbi:hypothetical protein [Rhodococcus chondri]|uniref:Pyridine nucleotide-disulfide oxidoreductase n=1 Tax=Rhodococcus chondri TaxID=3065941 RepID=A0ABU7JUN1_9NOCA|nr:hypothetical protein [Rhodococcus sp. CC-R104]MEE2033472.1 hypothetical protein [Rhodococcus sp. CC-R104]
MTTHLTADDLRELLGSELTDPALVLDEGRFRVVGADEVTDGNRAFVVLTRVELREQLPQDREYTDSDLELRASTLDSTVANLGG